MKTVLEAKKLTMKKLSKIFVPLVLLVSPLSAQAAVDYRDCETTPKSVLQHAVTDATLTFTRYERIPFNWVTVDTVVCSSSADTNNMLSVWILPSPDASDEWTENWDGCGVNYEYEEAVHNDLQILVKVDPGCA